MAGTDPAGIDPPRTDPTGTDPATAAADPCERLEWDSAFWGIPIARARTGRLDEQTARAVDAWCVEHEIRCCYLFGETNDGEAITATERLGFRHIDTRLTFAHCDPKSARDASILPSGISIRRSKAGDVPALRAIAGTAHRDTRFYADPAFPDDRCDELYRTWIENSCNGYADVVLVAAKDDDSIGYVSCHLHGETEPGTIGLVGVREDSRGRGAGVVLVHSALAWFVENGSPSVEVATQQRNDGAQRLYRKCGFTLDDARPWFHKWYSFEG